MRLNVIMREEQEWIKLVPEKLEDQLAVGFGSVQTVTTSDYNGLLNKPSINSVELVGALTAEELGLGSVYYDTTEHWEAQPELIAERATVYIYSDYYYIEDEGGNRTPIAGLKVGDGTSYLIDMPFVTDAMTYMLVTHIANNSVHITTAEREFWNNKVSAYMDRDTAETLVLSKTHYEKDGEIVGG